MSRRLKVYCLILGAFGGAVAFVAAISWMLDHLSDEQFLIALCCFGVLGIIFGVEGYLRDMRKFDRAGERDSCDE